MLRFVGALLCLCFMSLSAPVLGAHGSCDRRAIVQFNDSVTVRAQDGSFVGTRHKGDCVYISQLHRGVFSEHGNDRLWGSVNGRFYPITTEDGLILNVDPNDYLRELFAKEGVLLPWLPDASVNVTIALSELRFTHLRVRNGPDFTDYPIVDNVHHGQEIWITDILFLGGRDMTFVRGKVYSLYRGGETWISLGFLDRANNRVHRHVEKEGWEGLIRLYPELAKEVSRMEKN